MWICDIAAIDWQIPSASMKHVAIANEMQLEMFFNPKTFLNIIIVYEIAMNGPQLDMSFCRHIDAFQVLRSIVYSCWMTKLCNCNFKSVLFIIVSIVHPSSMDECVSVLSLCAHTMQAVLDWYMHCILPSSNNNKVNAEAKAKAKAICNLNVCVYCICIL